MSETSNTPVKVISYRGIRAAIFANLVKKNGGEFTMHKVDLSRSFEHDNRLKTVSNFARDEIPVAQVVLQKAYEFILEAEALQRKEKEQSA